MSKPKINKPPVHVCEGVEFVLLTEHEARTKALVGERDRYLKLWLEQGDVLKKDSKKKSELKRRVLLKLHRIKSLFESDQ